MYLFFVYALTCRQCQPGDALLVLFYLFIFLHTLTWKRMSQRAAEVVDAFFFFFSFNCKLTHSQPALRAANAETKGNKFYPKHDLEALLVIINVPKLMNELKKKKKIWHLSSNNHRIRRTWLIRYLLGKKQKTHTFSTIVNLALVSIASIFNAVMAMNLALSVESTHSEGTRFVCYNCFERRA